jgi:hypothetical protein
MKQMRLRLNFLLRLFPAKPNVCILMPEARVRPPAVPDRQTAIA